ncbi:hypothetical protein APR11_000382 [Nocardia amikacinitolerans]|uniref:hypothetical protein n=1 Tax=Nocardia amikacinitolerans TaxID=756689 RepID=UPI0020A5A20E|nr:hypothetical protein [Nocardia amikacinitolerans]MCP2293978.1 hypothetical protein [Nocardia amikacinitolerans]
MSEKETNKPRESFTISEAFDALGDNLAAQHPSGGDPDIGWARLKSALDEGEAAPDQFPFIDHATDTAAHRLETSTSATSPDTPKRDGRRARAPKTAGSRPTGRETTSNSRHRPAQEITRSSVGGSVSQISAVGVDFTVVRTRDSVLNSSSGLSINAPSRSAGRIRTGLILCMLLATDIGFFVYGQSAYTGKGDAGDVWRAVIFVGLLIVTGVWARVCWHRMFGKR